MARLFPPGYTFFKNGAALDSGTVTFYTTGTTDKKDTYPTSTLSGTANSNPVTLNSSGQLPVDVHGSGEYTVLIQDVNGATVESRNNFAGLGTDGPPKISEWGGTNGGNITSALSAACAAVKDTFKEVILDINSGTVDASTDCQGCRLRGIGTTLTGLPINTAGLEGITINTVDQSTYEAVAGFTEDSSPKLIYRFDTNTYYVFVKKPTRGYLLFIYVDNVTTVPQSLSSTSSDTTSLRLAKVLDASAPMVSYRTVAAESGSWTNGSSFSHVSPLPTWDSGINPQKNTTTGSGAYQEFTITPVKGRLNVALIAAATGGSNSVTIAIDGTTVATADLSTGDTLKTYWFYGYPDVAHTVRVTNNTTNTCAIAGCNFMLLDDWDGDDNAHFGYGRDSTYEDYLTNNSSNEAVIREFESQTYGLGYHGGEASITNTWIVDGVTTTLSVGDYSIGKSIELFTQCTVDWSGADASAGSVVARKWWRHGCGAIAMTGSFAGTDLVVDEVYTCMGGWDEAFDTLDVPIQKTVTSESDGTKIPLGRTNRMVLRDASNNQRIESEWTLTTNAENQFGGAWLWRVVGSYHKMYYAPVHSGKRSLSSLGWQCVHRFF